MPEGRNSTRRRRRSRIGGGQDAPDEADVMVDGTTEHSGGNDDRTSGSDHEEEGMDASVSRGADDTGIESDGVAPRRGSTRHTSQRRRNSRRRISDHTDDLRPDGEEQSSTNPGAVREEDTLVLEDVSDDEHEDRQADGQAQAAAASETVLPPEQEVPFTRIKPPKKLSPGLRKKAEAEHEAEKKTKRTRQRILTEAERKEADERLKQLGVLFANDPRETWRERNRLAESLWAEEEQIEDNAVREVIDDVAPFLETADQQETGPIDDEDDIEVIELEENRQGQPVEVPVVDRREDEAVEASDDDQDNGSVDGPRRRRRSRPMVGEEELQESVPVEAKSEVEGAEVAVEPESPYDPYSDSYSPPGAGEDFLPPDASEGQLDEELIARFKISDADRQTYRRRLKDLEEKGVDYEAATKWFAHDSDFSSIYEARLQRPTYEQDEDIGKMKRLQEKVLKELKLRNLALTAVGAVPIVGMAKTISDRGSEKARKRVLKAIKDYGPNPTATTMAGPLYASRRQEQTAQSISLGISSGLTTVTAGLGAAAIPATTGALVSGWAAKGAVKGGEGIASALGKLALKHGISKAESKATGNSATGAQRTRAVLEFLGMKSRLDLLEDSANGLEQKLSGEQVMNELLRLQIRRKLGMQDDNEDLLDRTPYLKSRASQKSVGSPTKRIELLKKREYLGAQELRYYQSFKKLEGDQKSKERYGAEVKAKLRNVNMLALMFKAEGLFKDGTERLRTTSGYGLADPLPPSEGSSFKSIFRT